MVNKVCEGGKRPPTDTLFALIHTGENQLAKPDLPEMKVSRFGLVNIFDFQPQDPGI